MATDPATTPNAAQIAQLIAQLSQATAPAALGPLGFAMSAAPEVIKLITAMNQMQEAKELAAKTVRPTYEIPQEVRDVVDIMRSGYMNSRLPGQAQAEGRLQAGTASGLRMARNAGQDPNAILTTLMGLNQQQNQGYENLAIQGANLQRSDRAGLADALNNMAGYRDYAFDYNQNQPYQEAMRTIGALRQAGGENLYGAAKGLSSSVIGAMNTLPPEWYQRRPNKGPVNSTMATTPADTYSGSPVDLRPKRPQYGSFQEAVEGNTPTPDRLGSYLKTDYYRKSF